MKKIMAISMILLTILSTFAIFAPQVKALDLASLPASALVHPPTGGYDGNLILYNIDVDPHTPGDQQTYVATAGETITVPFMFQIWAGAPGIIRQATFVYSWSPTWNPPASGCYYVAYHGIPGASPIPIEGSFSVNVPTEEGEYYIWLCGDAQYNVPDALNLIGDPTLPPGPYPAHAKIVVGVEAAVLATIDMDPDTLNLKSKGEWITCYIELPEGYNVSDTDIYSIRLNDTFPVSLLPNPPVPVPTEIGDYDNDGIPDLMVKFNRTELTSHIYNVLEITYGDVTLIISGNLTDGTPFEGSDTIKAILVGDVNHDSAIDSTDLGIFGVAWSNNPYNPNCDFNSDGVIDSTDYGLLATNYGATVP